MILAICFIQMPLAGWGNFLLFLTWWEFLSWTDTVKFFFFLFLWRLFLSFALLMRWITLIDFLMLTELCIPGINSLGNDIFFFLYISGFYLLIYFKYIICIHLQEWYWSVFFSLVISLPDLEFNIMLPYEISCKVVLSSLHSEIHFLWD